jgi:geranylgeranyl pyrophosphate synthase
VIQDLANTQSFAVNNILKTDYKQIEEVSLYNLKLKGKNFRSAILFSLAKAIHYNHPLVKDAENDDPIKTFENTRQYD